jgi:hypothetical protein
MLNHTRYGRAVVIRCVAPRTVTASRAKTTPIRWVLKEQLALWHRDAPCFGGDEVRS